MSNRSHRTFLLAVVATAGVAILPAAANAQTHASGGASYYPGPKHAYVHNGKAVPPRNAPKAVRDVIKAANKIVTKPYRLGGGHGRWNDSAYDCSGSVSFALHGAHLLDSPEDSSGLMGWGKGGTGKWITVYANGGHAFLVVAGLRFDTGWRDSYGQSHGDAPGSGPRWGKPRPTDGFVSRHPGGVK